MQIQPAPPTFVAKDYASGLHRATWTQTELFLTFPRSTDPAAPGLSSITLLPRNAPETGGRWRVWLFMDALSPGQLVWDRKIEEVRLPPNPFAAFRR